MVYRSNVSRQFSFMLISVSTLNVINRIKYGLRFIFETLFETAIDYASILNIKQGCIYFDVPSQIQWPKFYHIWSRFRKCFNQCARFRPCVRNNFFQLDQLPKQTFLSYRTRVEPANRPPTRMKSRTRFY